MNEGQPNLNTEALLAQARAKAAGIQQEREQKAEDARQTTVSEQVDKIYNDREEQSVIQTGLVKFSEQNQEHWKQINEQEQKLAKVQQGKQEAGQQLADENVTEEVKDVYKQVLDQATAEEQEAKAKIAEVTKEDQDLWAKKREDETRIETTTKEAKELMGYERNDFPNVAEYVQAMRKLKAEAKETLDRENFDSVVEHIWKEIQAGWNKTGRRNGSQGYVHEIDLDRWNMGHKKAFEILLQNPLLVTAIREKIFANVKVLEPQAELENWSRDGKATLAIQKAFQSDVSLVTVNDRGEKVKAQIWAGGHFNPLTSWGVSEERLPYLNTEPLTDDQKTKIEEAVNNPNIPIQELKMNLGFKVEPETNERIHEAALKENREVDRQKKLEKLSNQIDQLGKDIEELAVKIEKNQAKLERYEKVLEYWGFKQKLDTATNYKNSAESVFTESKQRLENLPRGLFGGVKNKDEQNRLQKRIAEVEPEIPKYAQQITDLTPKVKELESQLGNKIESWFDVQNMPKYIRSSLEFDKQQLEHRKKELSGLKTELEKTKAA